MPSILSHPAVPIAIACALGRKKIPISLLAAGIAASILPDADTLAFKFGIPYGHLLGHRGISHSLLFAFLVSLIVTVIFCKMYPRSINIFTFLFVSIASHGLLDAATNGGLGVAFFSPVSNHRYFFPWNPIAVAPLSPSRFFASRFLSIMISEIKWVWLPFLFLAVIGAGSRWAYNFKNIQLRSTQ